MRREPDERHRAALAAQLEPEHPVEAKLWRCSRGLETCEHMARALEIYGDLFERERLQPWIIADATSEDISERVGLSIETVQAYRHLFFNTSMFRDLLDKQRWVANYEQRPNTTREGALFLQKALLHGVEAVAQVMGAKCKLDPSDVLNTAMRDLFFRGLTVRDAKLTSTDAAAARGMLKDAVALAQEQAKVTPPGVNDILIRIKNRDDTKPLAAVQADAEILH